MSSFRNDLYWMYCTIEINCFNTNFNGFSASSSFIFIIFFLSLNEKIFWTEGWTKSWTLKTEKCWVYIFVHFTTINGQKACMQRCKISNGFSFLYICLAFKHFTELLTRNILIRNHVVFRGKEYYMLHLVIFSGNNAKTQILCSCRN